MVVVDASVWVASAERAEVSHADAQAFFETVAAAGVQILCPSLALAEAAGASARKSRNPLRGQSLVEAMKATPQTSWLALDDSLADTAADLAARLLLRGADAVYAATAKVNAATLIALDAELLTRARAEIPAMTPAEWIAAQQAAKPQA